MKRTSFCLIFLIFCIPSFSLNFGFEINQETVFSEKTEYIPAFFDNTVLPKVNLDFFIKANKVV